MNDSSVYCGTAASTVNPIVYLIIDVITRLPWTRIVLINDDFGRTHWPVQDQLSPDLPVVVFDYGKIQTGSDSTATAILNETLDPYGAGVNFLVLCDVDCVTDMFRTADGYETDHDEQGAFTFKAKWLTAVQHQYMREVENSLGNITNVAAVVPGSPHVYTALWKADGRRFSVVRSNRRGHIGLTSSSIFPNIAYIFNGRQFTVTTNMWGPFVKKKVDENNQTSYFGLCISMLQTLSTTLNFTYTLVEPPDGGWGSRNINGSWDGLVRQLHLKDADIAVAPLLSSHERETAVDFTCPFYIDHTVAAYRAPANAVSSQFGLFLTPFSWPVWLGLVAAVFVVGMALSLTWWYHPERYSGRSPQVSPAWPRTPRAPFSERQTTSGKIPTNSRVHNMPKPARGSYINSLTTHVWVAFGSVFSQEVYTKPTDWSVRVIFGFWCIFALIVAATYSGNLVAFLTVQKSIVPFRTLEELAANPDYFLGTLGTSAWQTLLEESKSGVYSDLWRKVTRSLRSGVRALDTKVDPHLAQVKKGGYVFISDTVSVSELVTQNCDIKIMDQKFQPVFNAIALQNNSAYRDTFSNAIARFEEAGLLAYWKQLYWSRVLPCDHQSVGTHHPLSVDGVKGVFLFTGVLLLLSLTIFIAEKITALKNCRCLHQNQSNP